MNLTIAVATARFSPAPETKWIMSADTVLLPQDIFNAPKDRLESIMFNVRTQQGNAEAILAESRWVPAQFAHLDYEV